MGTGFKCGGSSGAELSIRVVQYGSKEELPETARANTIAVITPEDITGWRFSAEQPEGKEGLIWFPTGADGVLTIEALKKNGITLYPVGCRQYADGSWTEVSAWVYQDGWKEVTGYRYLYKHGDTCEAVGGKWISEALAADSSATHAAYLQEPTVVYGSDSMTIYMDADSNKAGIVRKSGKISTAGYSRLVYNGKIASHEGIRLCVWSEMGDTQAANLVASAAASGMGAQWYVDLTMIPEGEYYVGIAFWGSTTEDALDMNYLRLE